MTGSSFAEGAEAVYANPAGLAAGRRRELTLGFTSAGYQLRIDGERDPLTPARGMVIGFSLPLPFGDVLQDRLVFGGAFYTPSDIVLRGDVRFPAVPQWAVLDRAQVLGVMLGLGVDLHGWVDGLQVGIGVSALANIYGDLFVELDETNSFSSLVETQLVTSFAPVLGARYIQETWGLGLTYRHELRSQMDLRIVTEDLPVELPVLTVGGVNQYDPPTLVAEGHFKPIPALMLVANLTTRFWDAYPGSQVPTTTMGLDAPHPSFSIRPSPRVAAEGTWREGRFTFALRGGYAFEPTPAPPARLAPRRTASGEDLVDMRVPFRLLDSHRHVLSLGGGWTVHLGPHGERVVLDIFGQAHLLHDRTHVIGRTDGAPPMVTGGTILAGGWTLRAEF